jgi:hypothetical protein
VKAKAILEAIAETLHGQAVELALDACEAAAHAGRVESLANMCDEEGAAKVVETLITSGLIKVDGDCIELTTDAPGDIVTTAKGGSA